VTIRAVLVDDEAPARNELRYLLAAHDEHALRVGRLRADLCFGPVADLCLLLPAGSGARSDRAHRRLYGVAACAQDLDPGTGRFRVDARDRTAGADCNRLLRGLRCRRSHLARDQRSDNSDQRSED